MQFIRTERLNFGLGFFGCLTALISMWSWGTRTWKIVAQSSFRHTENLKIEIYHEFMTIRQSNIQSSNHRLSSIEKKSHARLEPSADCGMPPPPAVHLQRWAASWTSAASTCPRATPSYGISGTLRFRITSDGCKDDISQRGLGEKCLHMAQPKGFVTEGKERMGCRLKKSIYGLKQASRQWYLKFDQIIRNFGFKENQLCLCKV